MTSLASVPRWLHAGIAGWGWRHFGWSLAASTLFCFNLGAFLGTPALLWPYIWVYNVPQYGLPFVFAMRAADAAVDDGVRPFWAFGVTALTVSMIGALLLGPLLMTPMEWLFGDYGPAPPPGTVTGDIQFLADGDVRLFGSRLMLLSLVATGYAYWRAEQRALHQLRGVEIERARVRLQLQSSRLQAQQARVDPQLLFDALGRVRDRITDASGAAELLLADLITLLRANHSAALAASSTVENEFAVVRAYARLSASPSLRPLPCAMHCDDSAAPARLAAAWLLPTLRRLADAAPATSWRVVARTVGQRLQLAIEAPAGDAEAQRALLCLDLALLQSQLRPVHGVDVHLALGDEPAATTALRLDAPLRFDTDTHDVIPSRTDR